ncbi:Ascofuranone/ascochlorin biosynthesis clusters transcription regulator [Cladobotryum mycophilum]|uniref:Ascofuranone/ascochlorin biosynthesis clusters transcription regulator n=1 Tax=Cladobotryum mycophilum TaxID=491253 RepID=A0ABR0SH68_9HYPO
MSASAVDSEKPLRFACNRCHAQKLRCPRSLDSDKGGPDEPCSRCRKAGATCVVSLRGKVGRPAKISKKRPTSAPRPYLSPEEEQQAYDVGVGSSLPTSDSERTATKRRRCPGPPPPRVVNMFGTDHDQDCNNNPSLIPTTNPTDGQLIFDHDHMLPSVDNDSMISMQHFTGDPSTLTPTASSIDNDDLDSATSVWSHNAWPNTTCDSPASSMEPSDSITANLEMDLNIPTFYFAPNLTQAGSSITVNSGHPPQPQVASCRPEQLRNRQSESSQAQPRNNTPSQNPRVVPSTEPFSSINCFRSLSDLNLRILQSCEVSSSTPDGSQSSSHQILRDSVQFAGELIDAARQSLPHIFPNGGFTSVSNSPSTDHNTDTINVQTGSADNWTSYESQPRAPCIPDSAIIFLLLGCYTQILHSFEIAINSLFSEHCDQASLDSRNTNTGNVQSLLEASLAVHTVTYLLNRMQRTFKLHEPEGNEDAAMDDQFGYMEDWKKPTPRTRVGADDGLLGRAFTEIRERETSLMRRAQDLRQILNTSNM